MSLPNLSGQNSAAYSPDFIVGPTKENKPFQDRRTTVGENQSRERRQFGSSHAGLSDAGRELSVAIDAFKIKHHRRYITCDDMLTVLRSLGYDRSES